MSQQQTVLRVYSNALNDQGVLSPYETLDLYDNVPIKINKSFAELQDIAKRNSDYSIGLTLPGSKKNNRFFESFFNVDSQSLYFNATLRVNCSVLLDNNTYFRGYMRLNKVSVLKSKVEYDVTLYSIVGDLFGEIGNNLLKDLNFTDTEYTFNHTFNLTGVTESFGQFNFFKDSEYTYPYFYPIVHNGYNYESISGATVPYVSGATINDQTRLYTSTSPISGWTSLSGATAAGVQPWFINSPIEGGLRDNQLKPALSIWSLIRLIFKSYGYTLSGDFFNTPWVKGLYLYGYFSSEATKFGYKLNNIEQLPLEGIEIVFTGSGTPTGNAIVCKKGTGIPCYCLSDINVTMIWDNPLPIYFQTANIPAGTSGSTITPGVRLFSQSESILVNSWQSIPFRDSFSLRYEPVAVGSTVSYTDGEYVDFNLVIDQNIKQIDILSSIAKKFDLVFVPNPENPKDIQVYPFDFYMGTGDIYDWTPKLSWDKGFTVEPALNFIESNLILTDQEDGDEGNRVFKLQNNRIYGQNYVYNPTDFKSQEKKIDTIFSPELIRVWDANINLPLGINYSASSEISTYDNQIRWLYKGVKSKPKLFYWMGANNPFIDKTGEVFPYNLNYNTYTVKVQDSSSPGGGIDSFYKIPTISHTMPIGGLTDSERITSGFDNDKLCILFNSEQPTDTIGVQTFNTYTENDIYNTFYNNRISNIYNPNTRFLNGYFDLKYSDVQNLYPNDVVKINEQFFYVNKISDFNLTNRELTKVELIQFNVQTQVYPTRYFKYQYCDQTGYTFKFKTDFTNSNLRDTNEAWALYYDYQLGSLTGSTTGFTSVFKYFNTTAVTENYVPYTMMEITKDQYDTGGYIDWTCDTLRNNLFSQGATFYLFPPFWQNIAVNKTGACVWDSCSSYSSAASTYSIRTGSSTYYGAKIC